MKRLLAQERSNSLSNSMVKATSTCDSKAGRGKRCGEFNLGKSAEFIWWGMPSTIGGFAVSIPGAICENRGQPKNPIVNDKATSDAG
jgi:hypothetical protein